MVSPGFSRRGRSSGITSQGTGRLYFVIHRSLIFARLFCHFHSPRCLSIRGRWGAFFTAYFPSSSPSARAAALRGAAVACEYMLMSANRHAHAPPPIRRCHSGFRHAAIIFILSAWYVIFAFRRLHRYDFSPFRARLTAPFISRRVARAA